MGPKTLVGDIGSTGPMADRSGTVATALGPVKRGLPCFRDYFELHSSDAASQGLATPYALHGSDFASRRASCPLLSGRMIAERYGVRHLFPFSFIMMTVRHGG